MLPVILQKFFLFLVLHVLMINFHQNTIEACEEGVIMACVDNTTCVQTYGEVYNILASEKNYHNIAKALHPAKRPSSVLVHIRLYGANGTENCTPAAYTWSMSCLYAAFPPNVLEILSWGSIIVTHRKQKLDITIPPFCCNVSKDNRVTMIDDVLAVLQDLAVSPGMQDPRLNTAECVIEGHEPKLTDTGRSTYIILTMWFSFTFTIFCGPWLAIITLTFFDKAKDKKENILAMIKAVKWVSWFMLSAEFVLLIVVFVLLACHSGNVRWHIYPILIMLLLEGLISLVAVAFDKLSMLQVSTFMWANLTAYHFCWLVIGIMFNALWGVTVLLFVCVIISTCVFAAYTYNYISGNIFNWYNASLCAIFFLSIGSLVAVVVLAGQSLFGRDTADDVIKTVILSVTVAFISWIISIMKKDNKETNPKDKDKDRGTGGGEGGGGGGDGDGDGDGTNAGTPLVKINSRLSQ